MALKSAEFCLPVSEIRTDGGTQPRARLNLEVVDEYAEAMLEGADFPPVTVFYDGESHYLADGYHRYEATKKIGSSTIAIDLRQGTRREAVLYSVGANASHGLRRTPEDKRRAVETLLRDPEWNEMSENAIAKICKVDNKTVKRTRVNLGIPKSNTRTGLNGRSIDTALIGRRKASTRSDKEGVRSTSPETLPSILISNPQEAATPSPIPAEDSAVALTTSNKISEIIQLQDARITPCIARLDRLLPEAGEDATSSQVGKLSDCLCITNFEWENSKFLADTQTCKIPLHLWLEGPSNLLPTLLQQISNNPDMRELMCDELSNSIKLVAQLVT